MDGPGYATSSKEFSKAHARGPPKTDGPTARPLIWLLNPPSWETAAIIEVVKSVDVGRKKTKKTMKRR